jgi:hypothetical protein
MLQPSIKVSLIVVSVEQLIYLLLTRCCVLPFLPITLQRHPCPLGRQNYFNKDRYGLGSRVRIYGKIFFFCAADQLTQLVPFVPS